MSGVAVVIAAAIAIAPAMPTFAANRTSAPAGATDEQLGGFDELSAKANEAADAGDWDTTLASASRAFASLPEHASSQGRRADLMMLVGSFGIEQRNAQQIERSVVILRGYVADLRDAYGARAEQLPAWASANACLADLEARLPKRAAPPATPPLDAAPRSIVVPDRTEAPVRPPATGVLVAGGMVTTAGGALSIAGFAFAGRWANEADAYTALAEREHGEPGSVTVEQEVAQHRAWTRARATSLGLAIPGLILAGVGIGLLVVGARRRADRGHVALSNRGVQVRF